MSAEDDHSLMGRTRKIFENFNLKMFKILTILPCFGIFLFLIQLLIHIIALDPDAAAATSGGRKCDVQTFKSSVYTEGLNKK